MPLNVANTFRPLIYGFVISAFLAPVNSSLAAEKYVNQIGQITDKNISEASGFAISQRNNDLLWTMNDSGNTEVLYAIDTHGKLVGSVKLAKVMNLMNHDWEDLSSFTFNGKSYIVVGDIGDNFSNRAFYTLYILEEPPIEQLSAQKTLTVKPTWWINFTYADGSRDSESLTVDAKNQKFIILSKRDHPPTLFEIPFFPVTDQFSIDANKIGKIQPMPEPTSTDWRNIKFAPFVKQPTGMEISPDGKYLIVITYINAFLYTLKKPYDWKSITSQNPKEIKLPYLPQAESVTFDKTGKYIYVTSEGSPEPLLKVDTTKFQ